MKNNFIQIALILLSFIAFTQLHAQSPQGKGKGKGSPEKVFAKMDTNGDQVIDMTEFNAFKEMRQEKRAENGKTPKKGNPEKAFGKMDTDNNGGISMDEFIAHREKMKAKREKRKGKKMQDAESDN